jgi:pimeloyl-ACP methyl ester carboxylesterase
LTAVDWLGLERDGTRLACLDYGGDGPPVLLLHGLAGHAGEWTDTAAWLTRTHRVLALEQRGHGRSERRPTDVSRAAFVADAAAAIERLAGGRAAVIGQSLGGHTAFLLAARHPELVGALAVAEASPAGGDPGLPIRVGKALSDWPVPFASREAAIEFFGNAAWADGLEDGRPRFDVDVMMGALAEVAVRSYWDEWAAIRCPTLVVRGQNGDVAPETVAEMRERLPAARFVTIAGAGHDLHLDRPGAFRAAVERFLTTRPASGSRR